MSKGILVAFIATISSLLSCLGLSSDLSADESHKHKGQGRTAVVLKEYPHEADDLNENVSPYAKAIVEKHGRQEWVAVLLTNELHRHMGLWNVVGAKMGIRAMEILNAPFDELSVVSLAGFDPPFSCINDGVQVSTGASLGRGTIAVAQFRRPEAIFYYKNTTLIMRVKPEISKEISKVIKEYSDKYVFQSPRYFRELDKGTVQYWLNWDRKSLFEEIQVQ